MTLWIVTKSFATLFAIAGIYVIKWAAGVNIMTAAVIYLVGWTVFYDGRFLADEYRKADAARNEASK